MRAVEVKSTFPLYLLHKYTRYRFWRIKTVDSQKHAGWLLSQDYSVAFGQNNPCRQKSAKLESFRK